jgi:hypothetical protein
VRSRSGEADERYPVLADEPVELHRPRRTVRLIATSFAATIVLVGGAAYAGTAYAIDRAESDLRRSRDQFTADLDQRRQERLREQAEMNRDLCTVITRLPADPDTDAMRRKYGCGPFVVSSPEAPSPSPPGASPTKRRTTPPPPKAAPAPAATTPAPPPPPAQPPAPPPPAGPPGDLLRVCLPLLGCLVL